MTTIQKIIDIPDDHRVLLDLTLPVELPVGKAEVQVIITPSSEKHPGRKPFEGLGGSLAGCPDFTGDALDIQREMRDEW